MALPQIKPMELSRRVEPFYHPDCVYELKMDGFRGVAYIDNGVCRLVSRKANVYKSFAPLCLAIAGLRFKNAIIDGEIVRLDEKMVEAFSMICCIDVVIRSST